MNQLTKAEAGEIRAQFEREYAADPYKPMEFQAMPTCEIAAFRALLPKHDCSLTLEHNPQKAFYQTVALYVENIAGPSPFVSAEEEAAALQSGELWDLQWYPDTPVGSCRLLASSLEAIFSYLESKA